MDSGSGVLASPRPSGETRAPWAAIAVDTAHGWFRDAGGRMGAAIAFYATLALGPVVVIAMALAGALVGRDSARTYVFREIAEMVGPGSAATIASLVSRVAWTQHGLAA
ncbi:MAG: hypothetical protein JSR18_07840, partial [Proteobacteria bacterium]|nr:hypothetical protein [Pseudomonadota bacterium]